MISTRGKVNFYKVSRTISCEEQRCRYLHFLNHLNKSSYKHLKWPWPELCSTHCQSLWLKRLHNLIMESVPFTFLIFYPNIFQHKLSISSTNFFILYLNILHSLLLSETRGMCDKCSALLVKHQWLNPSVLVSCKKKKEIIPSSVKSWHTWSRPFPNHHATTSRTDTKLFFFFSFFSRATTWHLLQRKY